MNNISLKFEYANTSKFFTILINKKEEFFKMFKPYMKYSKTSVMQ